MPEQANRLLQAENDRLRQQQRRYNETWRAEWRTNAARHPNELRISSPEPNISASDDDGVYSQAPVRNSVPLRQSQAQTRATQAEHTGRREPSSESGRTVWNGGVNDAFDPFRFVPFAIDSRLASVIAQWVLQQQPQQPQQQQQQQQQARPQKPAKEPKFCHYCGKAEHDEARCFRKKHNLRKLASERQRVAAVNVKLRAARDRREAAKQAYVARRGREWQARLASVPAPTVLSVEKRSRSATKTKLEKTRRQNRQWKVRFS